MSHHLEVVAFDGDAFSLTFPLTLTPRFTAGSPHDSARITPPLARPGSPAFPRASLGVRIDAGVPVDTVESDTHAIETFHDGGNSAASNSDLRIVTLPAVMMTGSASFAVAVAVAGVGAAAAGLLCANTAGAASASAMTMSVFFTSSPCTLDVLYLDSGS